MGGSGCRQNTAVPAAWPNFNGTTWNPAKSITDTDYRKHELQCYAAAVDKVRENAPKLEDWRDPARGCQSLLAWIECSAQWVKQLLFSVENPKYWQPEAELFKLQRNIS
ncbi:hypothetical protein E4U55_003718 [Claviceps digitariae]|nr:hypothetical protein E4U55_003718 [Claviceps digitariae]